jgi:hypothetical protein
MSRYIESFFFACLFTTIMVPACGTADAPMDKQSTEIVASGSHGFTQTIPFDFDTGNIAIEVIIPRVVQFALQNISAGDASIILHNTTLVTNGWFDAIAPYLPTAVGLPPHRGRRAVDHPTAAGLRRRDQP